MTTLRVELLWFQDCPNHESAERLLREEMDREGIADPIIRVEVADEETGKELCFPGSPTIRIDGKDIEPGWECCDDCSPRCCLYMTDFGLRGLPERRWITEAIRASQG